MEIVKSPDSLLPERPKPGWKTTEFFAVLGVHGLAAVAIVLDLLHANWTDGLSSVEGGVPIVALIVSAISQAVYGDHRAKLKSTYLRELASVKIAQIERDLGALSDGVPEVINNLTVRPSEPSE